MPKKKHPVTVDDLYHISTLEDPRISPNGRWIAYVQVSIDKLKNDYQRNIWLVSTEDGATIQLTRGGKDAQPRWAPDGQTLAFVSSRSEKPQIYLLKVCEPGGEARLLVEMPNGASNPNWSPGGQQIAFLSGMNAEERAKEGEEEDPPTNEFEAKQRAERKEYEEKKRWDPRISEQIPYRTGTAFLDDRYAQIYVTPAHADPGDSNVKPRRLTDIDAHHSDPVWTPDGKFILTARAAEPESDEPWRSNSLYRIRVSDGALEKLTDDTHADATPLPSPDGKWIAYTRLPKENMYTRILRLAVIPAKGGKPHDLNLEFDRSVALIALRPWTSFKWTADSSTLIFNVNSWGATEIYMVAAKGGQVERIVSGVMDMEELDLGSDGSLAFVACTPTSPPELFWLPPEAEAPRQMTEVNKRFLEEVLVQPTHELRFKSHDGLEIQGWYILPVGYREGKLYPLILNIHGGPHVMWTPSARTMWHEWQFHAARGYVVFYCNPRGGDGYGESFQRATHRAWGETDFPDLMAGVDALIEKGLVDPERMAVTGGSYGGFMTAWVVGHTDRFAAAVSQRGVYNLTSFYGTADVPALISDEFDIDPWEDPQMLWAYSPIAYAHQIKTPLLLIHSENDFRVPIEQGEQLFALVRRSGGTVRLVRYPRDGHELSRSGEPEHRVSRLTHMIDWFDHYCMPDKN